MLTGNRIQALVVAGRIVIDPFDVSSLRPSSYALTLGPEMLALTAPAEAALAHGFDGSKEMSLVEPTRDGFPIEPGQFCLAASRERIRLPDDLAATLALASRLCRLGLMSVGGALVNAGFGSVAPSTVTIELWNLTPRQIVIPELTPLCHLIVFQHEDASSIKWAQRPDDIGDGPVPAIYKKWPKTRRLVGPPPTPAVDNVVDD